MEIRPEANAIISILPERAPTFISGPPEQVAELIQALSDYDVEWWNHHPVNAIATGLRHAASQPELPNGEISQTCLNYLTDTTPESLPDNWRRPLLEAIDGAGENYFKAAQRDFDEQDVASGATNLCMAVNCAIIGQAAIRGWPHADADADINTIVGLASGQLPNSIATFNTIVDAMSDDQLDLNSAYGATAAVRDAARHGYFHAFGYTPERATQVARHAFDLVFHTGEPVP